MTMLLAGLYNREIMSILVAISFRCKTKQQSLTKINNHMDRDTELGMLSVIITMIVLYLSIWLFN